MNTAIFMDQLFHSGVRRAVLMEKLKMQEMQGQCRPNVTPPPTVTLVLHCSHGETWYNSICGGGLCMFLFLFSLGALLKKKKGGAMTKREACIDGDMVYIIGEVTCISSFIIIAASRVHE